MKKFRLKENSILLIFIIIVILFHIFGYTGHFGFDDLHYAELANDLINGQFNVEDHYAYRLPVILFTSLFYLIFGISDLASSLPAMLVTITILVIVFNILRQNGLMTIITGLSLVTFSHWFLFYSDKLMPDIYVALSVVSALAVIHHYKYKSGRSRIFLHAILLAFSLLFGFMAKGTIVLIIPLLLFLVITDILLKRDLKFWLHSMVAGVAMLAAYLLLIRIFTGDMMKRFEAIAGNSYLNLCSYDRQPPVVLLKRIFFGFFELSVYQAFVTGLIFVVASLIQKKVRVYFRFNDSFSFFLVSALILFLSSSFMTISLHSYAPMCLDPRHYLFLVPVTSIPAAKIISDFTESGKSATRIISLLFVVTIISFFLPGGTSWKLYLPLLSLFSIWLFPGIRSKYSHLFTALFVAILLVIPVDMIRYASGVKYREQREIVTGQLLEKNTDCRVITDEVQKRLLVYYSHFDPDEARRFLSFEEISADSSKEEKTLLLLNGYTRDLSGMSESDLPYYARYISLHNRLIFENRDPDMKIYEMKEFTRFDQTENKLLSTYNDFESAVPFWSTNNRDLSLDISRSGRNSNRVIRYSSTFDYPLDSLQFDTGQSLVIQCKLYCNAWDRSDARLVVSFEDSTGTYFWKGLDINHLIKAYSNWWPVSFDVTAGPGEIRKKSRLKVYVWKRGKPDLYIDDFGISLWSVVP